MPHIKMTFRNKYLLFVLLPTLLVAFYYGIWATNMYVSEARFSLRGPEGGGSTDVLALLGQSGGSTTADAYVVQDYIRSMGLLQTLDSRLDLKTHYQSDPGDLFSRLSKDASAEEFLRYYQKTTHIAFEPTTGIFTLTVRAYEPEVARDISQEILTLSEGLVNQLRDRALDDALELAHTELDHAEQQVSTLRERMKQFRQRSELLNPEAAAGALVSLLATLEAEAVKTRTEMAEARSYMREDSARINALKARIAALEGQIDAEKNRLTGPDQQVLNDVMADYEKLAIEREFAEKRYTSALTSLEAARIRAESQSRYLVAFSPPTLPDESLWPRRSRSVILAFVSANLLFGIVSLIIAAIREHAGF